MLFPRLHLWLRDRLTAKFMAYKPAAALAPRVSASMYADKRLCDAMASQGIVPTPPPPVPVPTPSGFSWWNLANSVGLAVIAAVLLMPHFQGCSMPGPSPTPTPAPVDPFTASLQTAYTSDTGPTKAQDLANLVGLFRLAVAVADDPTLTTTTAIHVKVKSAETNIANGALAGVRSLVDADLDATLPLSSALDRVKAKSEFTKIATALGAVK